jgi:hypothetical protein
MVRYVDDEAATVVIAVLDPALLSWSMGVEESMLDSDVEDVLEPTEDAGRTSGRLGGGGVTARMVKIRFVPVY